LSLDLQLQTGPTTRRRKQFFRERPFPLDSARLTRQELSIGFARAHRTNGIKDGYEIIAHLANQPFTQEFISVKLCRLFVHDDFYVGDDFTAPNLRGKLVKQAQAWKTVRPKDDSPVLATIFNSDLFRGHGGSKGKTPLEFVVSAIRRWDHPDERLRPTQTAGL
jgi:uncharacterized protein (DUF1800 family)